jgi:secondary thiamine-phosphate synthase enzyme
MALRGKKMKSWKLPIHTSGERFYDISKEVRSSLKGAITEQSGLLIVYNPHTSCGLTISESFDSSARVDMQKFLNHLAPRNLAFIEHTAEGPDDSPSHMKSILLETSLQLIIEDGKLLMGQWQGIYLCEFRDSNKTRTLQLKFIEA